MTFSVASVPHEIDVETLEEMSLTDHPHAVLDVREPWEVAVAAFGGSIHIPMRQLPFSLEQLPTDKDLVVICHHGIRSLRVMAWLRQNGFERVTSLRGGVQAWADRIDPSMPRY